MKDGQQISAFVSNLVNTIIRLYNYLLNILFNSHDYHYFCRYCGF